MRMLIPGGMSIGFLLIALAMGYIVCTQAKKETKGLKVLGNIIGTVIIAISGIIIINKILWFCNYAKCPLKGMMTQQQMPAIKK